MKRKRQKAPTKRLSKAGKVGRRQARRLKARGLDTPAKIQRWRAAHGRIRSAPKAQASSDDTSAGVLDAITFQRSRLLTAQADNEEIDRDRNRGRLVEVERVLNALEKAESMKVARERAAFVVSLPAKLGGQPADKIAAAYEKELNEIHAEYVKQFKILAGL